MKKIDNYDVVIGAIADDRMQYVFPRFIRGDITDKVLSECLKSVKLGDQWVFKNNNACKNILVLGSEKMNTNQLRFVNENQRKVLASIKGRVDQLERMYRRSGKYIDKIVECYR